MKIPPIVTYTVLRLLAFLVPFGLLMFFPLFREQYWLAAIFATLIGLSLSILFLRRPLGAVSTEISERRDARAQLRDEDIEDAVIDAPTATAEATAADAPRATQPTSD